MKSVYVISLLVILFCVSGCDIWKIIPLSVNNSAAFVAQKDSCGISLSVEKLSGPSTIVNIMVDCTAGVQLDLDSLHIIGDNGLTAERYVWSSKNKFIKERKVFVSEKQTFKIGFHISHDTANKVMLILPTGFAKCGNLALIVDTLRVAL